MLRARFDTFRANHAPRVQKLGLRRGKIPLLRCLESPHPGVGLIISWSLGRILSEHIASCPRKQQLCLMHFEHTRGAAFRPTTEAPLAKTFLSEPEPPGQDFLKFGEMSREILEAAPVA
jgi:hypothetical protein